MNKTDVIVIGSGIIGTPIALELARKGYQVTVVEKNADVGSGSTAGSCAIIRFYYSTYQSVAFAYEGLSYWMNWDSYLETNDKHGLAKYIQCGSVMLKTKGHDYQKILRHFQEAHVKHEDWDLTTLNAKLPICNHDSYWPATRPEQDPNYWNQKPVGQIKGAVYSPESGYVNDPQLATHNVMVAAQLRGVRLIVGKRVVQVLRNTEKVLGVMLDDGQQLDAPIVVNAAGPHSFIINRLAGVEEQMSIKTRALRHEVHLVSSPAGFDFEKNGYQVSDADNCIYFRPAANNTMLVGSEDPDCDPPQWIENPDDFDRGITDQQWRAQVSRLARRVDGIDLSKEKNGFAELYDVSDDWIPIYDKSDLNGFYMAVGTSGNQFKVGPLVGYAMAELIEQCQKGHGHDKDPVVVTGKYTKLQLNMGHYSRLRKINPNSSFSVRG